MSVVQFPPARLRFRGRGYALDQDQAQAWRGVEVEDVEAVGEALADLARERDAYAARVPALGSGGDAESFMARVRGEEVTDPCCYCGLQLDGSRTAIFKTPDGTAHIACHYSRLRGEVDALRRDNEALRAKLDAAILTRGRDVEAVAKAVRDYVHYFGCAEADGSYVLLGREGKLEEWIHGAMWRDDL